MKKFYLIFVLLVVNICGCVFTKKITSNDTATKDTRISFISCPVVRDTRSVPCWTSDYNGSTYYLTIQSDVSASVQPPMLGHKVLVEGIVSDSAKICGGIVLKEINISVMPERDANCNKMLPVDEHITIDFNPRPPGPSQGRLAFDPLPNQTPKEIPPQGPQSIDLYFDFDKAVSFRHPANLVKIIEIAKTIGATKAQITGVRGAHLLTDGTLLTESVDIGPRRAEEVANLLRGAGLATETTVDWIDAESEANGKNDWQSRRVTVFLTP